MSINKWVAKVSELRQDMIFDDDCTCGMSIWAEPHWLSAIAQLELAKQSLEMAALWQAREPKGGA